MQNNYGQMILVTFSLVLAFGCGGGQPTEETTPEDDQDQTVQESTTPVAPVESGAETDGGSGSPGAQLVEERCIGCHTLDVVYAETYSREQWLESVNLMVSRGARLTEEERDLVVDYLASR